MIISVYAELTQYQEVGGDMVQRIRDLGIYDVFEELHKYYEEDFHLFNRALFFILHGYSIQSKFHVFGQSWLDIKEKIAESVGINTETPFVKRMKKDIEGIEDEKDWYENIFLYSDLVLLRSTEVIETLQRYLDYQGNSNFKHLLMLKEQYVQMVGGALDPIRKNTGEIDYDQKNKCRQYSTQILVEIAEWEQKVADSNKELKEAMMEVNKKRTVTQSLRLEDNLKH